MSDVDPFEYRPPTEVTAPKYKAVRDAENDAFWAFHGVLVEAPDKRDKPRAYADITRACRAFYDAIREHAPASADRSAAERCVRIARMAANEAVALDLVPHDETVRIGLSHLLLARWQACAAIALGTP